MELIRRRVLQVKNQFRATICINIQSCQSVLGSRPLAMVSTLLLAASDFNLSFVFPIPQHIFPIW
jgi:hypothetical protein